MPKRKAPVLGGGGAEEKTLDTDFTTNGAGEQLTDDEIVEKMREVTADFALDEEELQAMIAQFNADAANAPDYHVALEQLEELRENSLLRVYWFIIYPESCNPDWIKLLVENGLRGVISPLHDKDFWPDGTPKKKHWHVILTYEGKKSRKQVEAVVNACGGVRLQTVENVTGAVRYLCHLDIHPDKVATDVGKVKYSSEDLIPFGGFDPYPHIKATQTQVNEAIKEMQMFIDKHDLIYWDDFVRLAYAEHPDWEFVMAKQSSMWIVKQFLQARHDRRSEAHAMKELAATKAQMDLVADEVHEVMRLFKMIVTGEVDEEMGAKNG